MENNLVETLAKISSEPGVVGCVFANNHGLCIGNRGESSSEAAGLVTAIYNEAMKLQGTNQQKSSSTSTSSSSTITPVISLEYGDKICLIHRNDDVTGAVYKKKK